MTAQGSIHDMDVMLVPDPTYKGIYIYSH